MGLYINGKHKRYVNHLKNSTIGEMALAVLDKLQKLLSAVTDKLAFWNWSADRYNANDREQLRRVCTQLLFRVGMTQFWV